MGKIVRLTESDLVRIVKRVINEDLVKDLLSPIILKATGKKYKIARYGDGSIGYELIGGPIGKAVTDRKTLEALLSQTGYEIPVQTGLIRPDTFNSTKHPKLFRQIGASL
jgi:hypothetical protein